MTSKATMEEKVDELLKSVQSLSREQKKSQTEINQRLDQLERDVSTNNEESAQRNEKQFKFNEDVMDRIDAATSHITKLPTEIQEVPGGEVSY